MTAWRRNRQAGFTLLEAVLGVALAAVIVGAIAAIAAQWLPNWRAGFADLQRADLLSLGVERIAADVAAAEPISPGGGDPAPLFDGQELSMTFVRSSFGPDQHPHLEVVRFAEIVDGRGFALVRTRAPFQPQAGRPPSTQFAFADSVALVRAPFRVSFAYAGPNRVWQPTWTSNQQLPQAVRITVRDSATQQVLAASTAATLNVTASMSPGQRAATQSDAGQNAQPSDEGGADRGASSGPNPVQTGAPSPPPQ